ncbi:hypothetical protein ABI59_24025 [Acidobacteria bacterium Mor1]|nr:hypothetical protein ABI59_24025 [Acidobacteria bacterium Mor1]
MSDRVVEYLLNAGKVSRGQVDEARRTQRFFGGELASHLLKLGFVDERMLGEALTDTIGVPYASREKLQDIPGDVIRRIPASLVELHRACPMQQSGGVLRVAMLNPRDPIALRELESACGLRIEPWVTIEYRLYSALERYYRVQAKGIRSLSLAPPSEARQHATPAEGPAPEPEPESELGLDGLPLDAEPDSQLLYGLRSDSPDDPGTDPEATMPGMLATPAGVDAPGAAGGSAAAATPAATGAAESPRDPMERLEEQLVAAPNPESVGRALLEYSATHASRAALFSIGKQGLRGVTGRGRGLSDDLIHAVELPADGDNLLARTARDGEFYFGPPAGDSGDRDLFTVLGGRTPATLQLVPIRVAGRTAALLYLDHEANPLPNPDRVAWQRVAAKAGMALELVILRQKLRRI